MTLTLLASLLSLCALATPDGKSKGSIAGQVWYDSNVDGCQGAMEPGLAGVVVELLNGQRMVREVVTDVHGAFRFEDLPPGRYAVRAVPPFDLYFTNGMDSTGLWPHLLKIGRGTRHIGIAFGLQRAKVSEDLDLSPIPGPPG